MKPSVITSTLLLALTMSGLATAQQMPTPPKPTKEHGWLKKFVGRWAVTSRGVAAEGQPAIETSGTINSQMMGGFWVINRMSAKVGEMSFRGIQTIGYDAKKKKYVGTWIDSLNGNMWHYTGAIEKNGTKIVLEADGPDMVDPDKTTKYRDAYEFKSKDEIIVTSSMQMPDGSWSTFMNGTAKRMPKKTKAKKTPEKKKGKSDSATP